MKNILQMTNTKTLLPPTKKQAAECIPTKPRAKCRVQWESIAVRKKMRYEKKTSLLNINNLTNTNAQKHKLREN